MKRVFLLFTALLLVFSLAACADLIPERDLRIEDVGIQKTTLEDRYVLADFDLSSIKLELLMEDDTVRYRRLEDDFIVPDDLDKLSEPGSHTINVTFEGFDVSFDLVLLESEHELIVHKIYTLGVNDGSIEEGYEAWKASISGEDGTDGREIELSVENDAIVWRYVDDTEWTVLVSLNELVEDIEMKDEVYLVQFFAGSDIIGLDLVERGEAANAPDPEREGMTFLEWDNDFSEVTSNLIVTGVYETNSFTIDFESAFDEPASLTADYGEELTLPVPEADDHIFLGWYYDADFSRLFNEGTMPAKDLILHAKFIDASLNDGETGEVVADMIARVGDGVIGVRNVQNGSVAGTGSGVIYKQEGSTYYVFTNHHVVEDADSLEVVFEKNGNVFFYDSGIDLLGSYEGADIAVLTFTSTVDFEVLEFADSLDVRRGERVYAIGSPQGFTFIGSVTTGVISNVDVPINGNGLDAYFFQHDAAISPGNSGGALIDETGRIIGMNTLKITGDDVEGMGLALSSNIIERMAEELETEGSITRAILGISIANLDECGVFSGVCVENVSNNTTADELGLEADDLITHIRTGTMDDFVEVRNRHRLRKILLSLRPGDAIALRYERGGTIYETDEEPLGS